MAVSIDEIIEDGVRYISAGILLWRDKPAGEVEVERQKGMFSALTGVYAEITVSAKVYPDGPPRKVHEG